MRKLTRQEKRRIRDARRKLAQLEQQHHHEAFTAANRAREEGRIAGVQQGARIIREKVLDHAGRLYKEGRDDAAKAVRDVHGLLPATL